MEVPGRDGHVQRADRRGSTTHGAARHRPGRRRHGGRADGRGGAARRSRPGGVRRRIPEPARAAPSWQTPSPTPSPACHPNRCSSPPRVARRTRSTPERVEQFAEQVLAELAAEDPDLTAWLRPRLPDDCAALLRPAPVPDAAVAGHPRRILPDELDRRLRELEDWSGDCHRHKPNGPAAAGVDRAAPPEGRPGGNRTCDRHVRTEWIKTAACGSSRGPESIDAVTELDLSLAARIDEAVRTL